MSSTSGSESLPSEDELEELRYGARRRAGVLPVRSSGSGEFSSGDDSDEEPDQQRRGSHVMAADRASDSGDASSSGDDEEDHAEEEHAEDVLAAARARYQRLQVQREQQLEEMPMGERAALLADGSESLLSSRQRASVRGSHQGSGSQVARKRKRAAAEHDSGSGNDDDRPQQASTRQADDAPPRKRASKHAPSEAKISRRPVDVLRDSMQTKRARHQDPRFLPVGGAEPEAVARKRFGFLYNATLPAEVKELKAELKSERDPVARKRLQVKISKLQQVLKMHETKELEDEVEREHKAKERQALAAGKKNVYHLKASDKQKLVLAKRFERLEKSGQLDKYMAKRRKRSAAKDHKRLPSRRRVE